MNLKKFPPFTGGGVTIVPTLHGGRRCLLMTVEGSGVSSVWWPTTDHRSWELVEEYHEAAEVKPVPKPVEGLEETLDELLARIG